MNLWEAVVEACAKCSDKPAIIVARSQPSLATGTHEDPADSSSLVLLYSELLSSARVLAKHLLDEECICAGNRVALFFEPSLEMIVCILGILCSGCTYVPLDPVHPSAYVEKRLHNAQATHILGPLSSHSDIANLKPVNGSVRVLECGHDSLVQPIILFHMHVDERNERDQDTKKGKGSRSADAKFAYILTTSGSTGIPTTVAVPHEAIIVNLREISNIFKLNSTDVVLLSSSYTFDMSVIDIFCTLMSKATLVILPKNARIIPKAVLSAILSHRVTVIHCTPSFFLRLGDDTIADVIVGSSESCVRLIAMGGERFPSPNRIHAWLPRITSRTHKNGQTHTHATKHAYYFTYSNKSTTTSPNREDADNGNMTCNPITNNRIQVTDANANMRTHKHQSKLVTESIDTLNSVVSSTNLIPCREIVLWNLYGTTEVSVWAMANEVGTIKLCQAEYVKHSIQPPKCTPALISTRSQSQPLPSSSLPTPTQENWRVERKVSLSPSLYRHSHLEPLSPAHEQMPFTVYPNPSYQHPSLETQPPCYVSANVVPPPEPKPAYTKSSSPEQSRTRQHTYSTASSTLFKSKHCDRVRCRTLAKDSVDLGTVLPSVIVKTRSLTSSGLEEFTENSDSVEEILIGGEGRICEVQGCETDSLRSTGDVVYRCECGRIWYVGRTNGQFKRFGNRLHVAYIEREVRTCFSSVVDCAAVYIAENDVLALFVQMTHTTAQPASSSILPVKIYKVAFTKEKERNSVEDLNTTANAIYAHLAESLPFHYIPNAMFIAPTLPLTTNGKVDTKFLVDFIAKCDHNMHTPVGDAIVRLTRKDIHRSITDLLGSSHPNKEPPEDTSQWYLVSAGYSSIDAVQVVETILRILRFQVSANEQQAILDSVLNQPFNQVLDTVMSTLPGSFESAFPSLPTTNQFGTTCISTASHTDEYRDTSTCSSTQTITHIANTPSSMKRPSFDGYKSSILTVPKKHRSKSEQVCTNASANATIRERSPWVQKWKIGLGKCVDASPILIRIPVEYQGRRRTTFTTHVCVGSHAGVLVCARMSDGHERYRLNVGSRIESAAAFASQSLRLVVGCHDHRVLVVDARTGVILHIYVCGDVVKSGIIVHEKDENTEWALIGSHDGYMHCIEVDTGRLVFKTPCGGAVRATPSLDTERQHVYVATLSGKMKCICMSSICKTNKLGAVIWTYEGNGKPIFATPALCNSPSGILYIGVDGCVYFLTRDGQLIWRREVGAPVFSSPSLLSTPNGDIALFGAHDGYLRCLSMTKGDVIWQVRAGDGIYAKPVLTTFVDSTERRTGVVVATIEGSLHVFWTEDGEKVFTHDSNLRLYGQLFSSPVVHSSARGVELAIGCRDDNLYCYSFDHSKII
eukprot:CFRG4683T1